MKLLCHLFCLLLSLEVAAIAAEDATSVEHHWTEWLKEAIKALEWKAGQFPLWTYENGKPKGQDDRLAAFQKKWESVMAEWSKQWGRRVSGWWFDGCYYPDAMYRHPEVPNFASFAAAARVGNPDSVVAFNPGVPNPIITLTPEEDYTAGEILHGLLSWIYVICFACTRRPDEVR